MPSPANNLVAQDTGVAAQVYVRDRARGAIAQDGCALGTIDELVQALMGPRPVPDYARCCKPPDVLSQVCGILEVVHLGGGVAASSVSMR